MMEVLSSLRATLGTLCLVLLTGCMVTVPKAGTTLKLLPPVELLQDCVVSDYRTMSNADLSNAVLVLRKDLTQCNNDKAALREWSTKE